MHVEVVESDPTDLSVSHKIHSFDEVLSLEHQSGTEANENLDRIYLTMKNGTETLIGQDKALHIETVEVE